MRAFAYRFLATLIDEAQRWGLRVILSIEPFSGAVSKRFLDPTSDNHEGWTRTTVEAIRAVARLYPQVDELELITRENTAPPLQPGELEARLHRAIQRLLPRATGDDVQTLLDGLSEDVLAHPSPHVSATRQVECFLDVLEASAVAFAALQWSADDSELGPWLAARRSSIGVYSTAPGMVRSAAVVLLAAAPPEMDLAWIPSHGAAAVEDNLRRMALSPQQRQRLRVYSWIELDGYMYTPQLPVTGLLANAASAAAASACDPTRGGLLLHHWRTAEIEPGLLLAAMATADGPDRGRFVAALAALWGVLDLPAAELAVAALEHLQDVSLDDGLAVGFCYFGVWWNCDKPDRRMSYVNCVKAQRLETATAAADAAVRVLRDLHRTSHAPSGRRRLAHLTATVEAAVHHFRCAAAMAAMRDVVQAMGRTSPTDAQRERVQALGDEALSHARRWQKVIAGGVADRGSAGMLVSYERVIVRYIRSCQGRFGLGDYDPDHEPVASIDEALQAPALLD